VKIEPNELQDLNDILGDIRNAAGSHDLIFLIQLQIEGKIPIEVKEKLNQLLAKVNDQIIFQ